MSLIWFHVTIPMSFFLIINSEIHGPGRPSVDPYILPALHTYLQSIYRYSAVVTSVATSREVMGLNLTSETMGIFSATIPTQGELDTGSMGRSSHWSTLILQPPNYSIWIFIHLKLCLADAIHNFKWVKIIHIWQNGGELFSNIADWCHILSLKCLKGGT